jgi:signal transduction histidine kinase
VQALRGYSMVRTTANILLAMAAVALLGVLVLLSTAPGDPHRRLDASLRQAADIVQAIERELVNMRTLNVDGRDRLSALSDALDSALQRIGADLALAFPTKPNQLHRIRATLVDGFHSIGGTPGAAANSERVGRDFTALTRQSDQLRAHVAAYINGYSTFRELSDAAGHESREFVRELRERRQIEAADVVFRGSQQVLQRVERGGEADLQQITAIIARLAPDADVRSLADRERLEVLAEQLEELVPARRSLDQAFDGVLQLQLTRPISVLRDQIGRDHLYQLSTVNDSRVLLNIYTALLLLVLAYFGVRLQRSYRVVNASHAELAAMNASLEGRVRQRTKDLERAYNDLKESQVQLVQAEKMSSLGQLVAGVMHEINTPLLYVVNNQTTTAENLHDLKRCIEQANNVVTVLKTPGATAEQLRDALKQLRRAIEDLTPLETMEEIEGLLTDNTDGLNQISELVQSLKDFSRLDRAAEDRFDVRDGIEKTLTITHNLWKYGVDVRKEFDNVPEILCAPSKINQVFINLITNAVQAMDGQGTLTLRTRYCDGWVEVDVEDTGCGIPEQNLSKIMDPFFTTKPVGQGTGLGMSIVSKIVDEHGGTIEIDSTVGVGTRFTIRLPAQHASAEAA